MDVNDFLQVGQSAAASYSAQRQGNEIDAQLYADRERRSQFINSLFDGRDYQQQVMPDPYWDVVRPIVVGFGVGMPQTLGDTIGGLGTVIRWMDGIANGQEEGWLSSLASVIETGGDWVAEHPWMPEQSVTRLRATVANPLIDDDGQPIWSPKAWLTDKEGQFDLHRRIIQSANSMAANIGQSALPFVAELALTRGAGKIGLLGKEAQLAARLGGVSKGMMALEIGAMGTVTARQQYRDLIAEGVDPDIAAREASRYGSVAGPIEYAEAILGTKLFKGVTASMPGGAGLGSAFDFVAQKILGEGGKWGTIRGMAAEGMEEVVQGVLTNPSRSRAFSAMQSRNPQWTPTVGDWYTLNDAYNDFAVGAGAAGFLRMAGRLVRSGAEQAKGETREAPVTPAKEAILTIPQSTGSAWGPVSGIETVFRSVLDKMSARVGVDENAKQGLDITTDDLRMAAALYSEDREAGLKYLQDRLNMSAIDTTKLGDEVNKEIVDKITARNERVATDDSRATAFLSEESAIDRPVRQPNIAIPTSRVENMGLSIEKSHLDSDLALKVHLGIPERTGGVILPNERKALDSLKSTMQAIWDVNPDARVIQTLAPVASMTPQEARSRGIDDTTAPLDADGSGNVLVRIPPSVRIDPKTGVPTIRLPRAFTLKDLQQAQVQLLSTENGAQGVNEPWNQNARALVSETRKWLNTVKKAVAVAAATDTPLELDLVRELPNKIQALQRKAQRLMDVAKSDNATEHQATLQDALNRMQDKAFTADDAATLATRMEQIASELSETSEAAKARALLNAMRKGTGSALAHMIARPDMIPDAAKPIKNATEIGVLLMKQSRNAAWIQENAGKIAATVFPTSVGMIRAMTPSEQEAALLENDDDASITSIQEDAKNLVEAVTEMDKDIADSMAEAKDELEGIEKELMDVGKQVEGMIQIAERLDIPENIVAKLPRDVRAILAEDYYAQQVISSMVMARTGDTTDSEMAQRITEAVRTRSTGGMRFQTFSSLPAISSAELDARILQVAKTMNGTLTVNPDGTRTLRLGQYELTISTPTEIVVNGEVVPNVNGVNIVARDTAMGGKITSWQIQLGTTADATTAAHEVVHSGLDLLTVEEQEVLAADMGARQFDEQTIEQVTQQIATAIVTEQKVGTIGSRAALIWDRIKKVIDSMFHLQFGEAWQAIKSLPIAVRADAIRGMVMRGEVFSREGTQRTADVSMQAVTPSQDAEYMAAVQRGDMATAQRMVDEAATKAGLRPEVVYHGSPSHGFTVFDRDKGIAQRDPGFYGEGIYFTANKALADKYALKSIGGDTYSVRLRMQNPYMGFKARSKGIRDGNIPSDIVDDVRRLTSDAADDRRDMADSEGWSVINPSSSEMIKEQDDSRAVTQVLKQRGYDGVIAENSAGVTEYVVFNSYQIKSSEPITRDDYGNVIPLSQRFNPQSPDIRFQTREQTREEKSGTVVVWASNIIDLVTTIRKLKDQVAESKEALKTEREIVDLVQKNTRFKATEKEIVKFEMASGAGNSVLESLTRANLPELEARRLAAQEGATTLLSTLGVDVEGSDLPAFIADLSMPQIRQLIRGLTKGVDRSLLKYYVRQAKTLRAEARKFDAKGKRGDFWSDNFKGENLEESAARLYDQWSANKTSSDWEVWKGMASELDRIIESNKTALSDAAKAQQEVAKNTSAEMAADMDKEIAANPERSEGWYRTFIDGLAAPMSALGRMGPLVKEIFYNRIRAARGRATALMRTTVRTFAESLEKLGIKTEADLNRMATETRTITTHDSPMEMTGNEVAHLVGMITDPNTLKAILRGDPVVMGSDENAIGKIWMSESIRNVFAPRGAKGLTWVNADTGETVKDTKRSPGSEWYSPELEKGVREFIAQVTPTEWQMAAAQKQAFSTIMQRTNESEEKNHNRTVFPEEAFAHTDDALASRWNMPQGTVFGYTPRFRDTTYDQKKYSNQAEYAALMVGVLEETGAVQERSSSVDKPLLVRDMTVVVDQRSSQLARFAEMQEDIRRALDFLGNQENQDGGFRDTLQKNYGEGAINAILEYLNRASGFGMNRPSFPVWDKIASNFLVARLAGRVTSYLFNRYVSIIAAREWMKQDAEREGMPSSVANSFAKRAIAPIPARKAGTPEYEAREKLLSDPNTGYFWTRWMKDQFRTYTQSDMDASVLSPRANLRTIKMQNWFMEWFAVAEERVAVASFLAYKDAGYTDSQAVSKVEAMFRATQNPSDSLEESAMLRKVKQTNIAWMFPYIGQTMAMRNLLVDSVLGLKDPEKRGASRQMLLAVGMSMVASEAFRAMVRNVIRPDDEDEEEDRRKKMALNVLRDAIGTIAPGVGDTVLALLQGSKTDKGLLAQSMADVLALPALSVKAVTADDTSQPIELKQWIEATSKTIVATASGVGIPLGGGGEQVSQALIERLAPKTKQEQAKIIAVDVMDSLPDNPTRADFDSAVRLAYRMGVKEGTIDGKKTSNAEFRNRFRNRVIDNYGKETAKRWGFKVEEKKD